MPIILATLLRSLDFNEGFFSFIVVSALEIDSNNRSTNLIVLPSLLLNIFPSGPSTEPKFICTKL